MKLLLDTQILLWSVARSNRLSNAVLRLIESTDHIELFSAVSIWEIAIKSSLKRADFQVDPVQILDAARIDFDEVTLTSETALRVADLPLHHRDPFDRLLVAQALAEDAHLLTADAALTAYGPPVLTLAAAAARDPAP